MQEIAYLNKGVVALARLEQDSAPTSKIRWHRKMGCLPNVSSFPTRHALLQTLKGPSEIPRVSWGIRPRVLASLHL